VPHGLTRHPRSFSEAQKRVIVYSSQIPRALIKPGRSFGHIVELEVPIAAVLLRAIRERGLLMKMARIGGFGVLLLAAWTLEAHAQNLDRDRRGNGLLL
jgi:hypothetical protein